MTREAILELVRKVKKLADAGIDGEASSAKIKYQRLCKKYNLTDDDFIISEKQENKYFIYNNQFHRSLLSNIICMILEVPVFKCGESNNVLRIKLTNTQFYDITSAYNYYKDMFDDYCRYLVQGIISRNAIGYIPKKTENDSISPQMPELNNNSEKIENTESAFDMEKLMKIAVALDKKPWKKPSSDKNLPDTTRFDIM
jgi:hypothetical protein